MPRTYAIVLIGTALVTALLTPSVGQAEILLASSHFDDSGTCAEEWSGTNIDGGAENLVCVSDPEGGGFISARENKGDGRTLCFAAPAKFLGDKGSAYGGRLSYRLRQIHNDQMAHGADVRLRSNGIELVHDYEYMPTLNWDWHDVPLDTTGGWRFAGTQQYATEEIIRTVLRQLDGLLLRAEFSTRQKEQTDLDDVELLAPEPSTPPILRITRLPDGRVDVAWPIVYDTYWPETSPTGGLGTWKNIPGLQIAGMVDGYWHVRLEPAEAVAFIRLRKSR
jgi:hypothetical protein